LEVVLRRLKFWRDLRVDVMFFELSGTPVDVRVDLEAPERIILNTWGNQS
jgi:hypothetical protein